jgi:hypothetical protein
LAGSPRSTVVFQVACSSVKVDDTTNFGMEFMRSASSS